MTRCLRWIAWYWEMNTNEKKNILNYVLDKLSSCDKNGSTLYVQLF